MRATSAPIKVEAADLVKAPPSPPPRVETPPPEPIEPSGYVVALTRQIDMELQLEYAFAKHMTLEFERKKLSAQYDAIAGLPVGIECIKKELKALPVDDLYTEQEQ